MRRLAKGLLGAILVLVLVLGLVLAALAGWKREEVTRLMAVNALFDAGGIVQNFSHMDSMLRAVTPPRGPGPMSALPPGPAATLSPGARTWVKDRAITGLVVLKGGHLVHENYYLGTALHDRRISWSMAKSVLSCLMGVVLAEGKIASPDDPVVTYAPLLVGSAYDGQRSTTC